MHICNGAFAVERGVKMPKDDIFRLIYTILKELYEHKKEGTQTPLEDIGPERLCIPVPYWVSIICDLIDEAYISGAKYRKTKTGKVLTGLDDIEITLKGVEYLQENSMMKKVCAALNGIKDIAPGL